MTINNNSPEQINIALLDIEQKLKSLTNNSEAVDKLITDVSTIKSSLNETKSGLTSGATYNINITGNAATATTATNAGYATNADHAGNAATADYATNAGNAATADYATNAGNATTATTANTAGLAETVDMEWLVNAIYPVNSVYISGVDTDPSTLFGGTWEAIFISDEVFSWKRTA